jgi:hypothetical protein
VGPYTIFLYEVPRNVAEGMRAKVGGAGGAMEGVGQHVTLVTMISVTRKGGYYTVFLYKVPRNDTEGTYAKVGGMGGVMDAVGQNVACHGRRGTTCYAWYDDFCEPKGGSITRSFSTKRRGMTRKGHVQR